VLLVASGLRGVTGHNFSYTRSVEEALRERGFEVAVFVHKHAQRELVRDLGYRAVFSLGTYDLPPGNGRWRDLAYLYAQSLIYADEMERALAEHAPFDLVFCHTVSDFELIGWDRCLRRTPFRSRLAIMERLTPGFASRSRLKVRLHPYWRLKPHYLGAIRRRLGDDRFLLLTDSSLLAGDYARVYPHRIATLPLPLARAVAVDEPEARPGRRGSLRIGYLGDARPAKGFALLPALAERLLQGEPGGLTLVIQCITNEYEPGVKPPGLDRLVEMAEMSGAGIELVHGALTEAAYFELFRSLDLVVLPYIDRHFDEGTSNVFAEALALGKPVVVPSGTWMADQLRRAGAGVEFRRGDGEALVAAVGEAVRGYDELAARAAATARSWREQHNPDSLVDRLLKETVLT
jgi:glycosyltransferase involved in cell wall biosynthesis